MRDYSKAATVREQWTLTVIGISIGIALALIWEIFR